MMNQDAFDFIRNSLNRIADGIASSDGSYPVWDYKSLLELINTLEEEYKKNDGASARSRLQQTCNNLATDCISRAAAIDAVNTWFELYVVNRTTANAVSIQDMLRALPSARPEQRWILCSERVPEEDEQVLVYLYDSPYIAWIDSNGEWNTEEFTLDKEKEREDEPIAWMPLPEPYKERREG